MIPSSPQSSADWLEIRQLIDNWVLWRDTGDWERLATVWHPEGKMVTTWSSEVSGTDFIARARKAWDAGGKALHVLGGSTIDIDGGRAIAQTRMEIINRAAVHGVMVDVHCHGRFFDFLERHDGRWVLRLRLPIYELDRMTTVDPDATLSLDKSLLASFPEGYRYLAYLQTQMGFDVKRTLPGLRDPLVSLIQDRGSQWLRGGDASCLVLGI